MENNILESILQKYFQRKIELIIDGEPFKQGQFILFRNMTEQNNYYFELSIRRKEKIETIKIPYPYDVEEYDDEGLLYLDYRNITLVKNNKSLLDKLNAYVETHTEEKSKFFNKILEIQFT